MIYIIFLVIVALAGVTIEYFRFKKRTAKILDDSNSFLVKEGRQIEVNLEECDIIESKLSGDNTISGSLQLQMLDGLYRHDNTKSDGIEGCYIVYKHKNEHGQVIRYLSPPIPLSSVMVKFRIMEHPKTNIYVDFQNSEKYFFDISFLLAR